MVQLDLDARWVQILKPSSGWQDNHSPQMAWPGLARCRLLLHTGVLRTVSQELE